ncbi:hypothetical protein Tco_1556212 [Tanacetum coccineum]
MRLWNKVRTYKLENGSKKRFLGTSLDPPWSDLELHLARIVVKGGGDLWEYTARKGGDGGAFICLVAKGGDGGDCKVLGWLLEVLSKLARSAPKEKTSKCTGKSKEASKPHQKSTGKFAQVEEPIHTVEDLEELVPQEFNTGFIEDQLDDETTQLPDCMLAQKEDPHESFNELMDTLIDFSEFVMNRFNVDTLTPELLADLTFELMKGLCKSLVELEYFLEEVYKATTDQLNWNNPEG